ncbi:endosomal transmembrane epsin interactor 1 isoform X1 [Engraulis encrasicolus]|uniref:endosomal transmembrane epsin interactor 1 isoform X1 n=1 Tax=Engraulis encrasicolus TaxID=184585 RepID=UPI002FD2883F
MSLPVVLPGSCCRVSRVSLAPTLGDPSYRGRSRCIPTPGSRMPGSQSRIIPALLPGRPLLSLGLLQLALGCSMVALSFGALSLSNSPPVRNSCPFWAGSSVILSGIIGLTTWRRPMLLLVNLFILLSVVCVLLNLAGFILCCQGAQLVSSMTNCQLSELGDICNCCAETPTTKCEEDKMLKIYPGYSCNTMRMLLKKVMFALCALNAVTTAVCLVAAALRYLQIFSARRPCMEEPRPATEDVEAEEQTRAPDPDEFVPPAPPPSYFSTFYSYTPRLARRMFGDSVIPLPHIYGARIKGVEVFCPLDPPPPYEAVPGVSTASPGSPASPAQETQIQMTDLTDGLTESSDTASSINDSSCLQTATSSASAPAAAGPAVPQPPSRRAQKQQQQQQHLRRSSSDPVLLDLAFKVLSCEAATQTDTGVPAPHSKANARQAQAQAKAHGGGQTQGGGGAAASSSLGAVVTLRRGGKGPRRPRPSSMVDYQSYRDTKLLVARFLEHSSSWSSLAPEVQELVNSIKSMLHADEEHMEEAVRCASFIDQVIIGSEGPTSRPAATPTPTPPALLTPSTTSTTSSSSTVAAAQAVTAASGAGALAVSPGSLLAQTLPRRKRPGQLHLSSCGDLSTFTWAELQLGGSVDRRRPGSRAASSRMGSSSRSGSSRLGSRAGSSRLGEQDRPHSLIGVFRETVL